MTVDMEEWTVVVKRLAKASRVTALQVRILSLPPIESVGSSVALTWEHLARHCVESLQPGNN